MRWRFDGAIAGIGTASGTRIVIGMWPDSPFGFVVDAMVERTDGHRILLAVSPELASFVSSTYSFDEVRVEPLLLRIEGRTWTVTSPSLSVSLVTRRRTLVGVLLTLVPRPLARTAFWCRLIDPIARRVRRGVRTVGTAGGGRREYYCALDEHRLARVSASFDGVPLGSLRPVTPPVRFGFGSTPALPSLVRVTTLIRSSA